VLNKDPHMGLMYQGWLEGFAYNYIKHEGRHLSEKKLMYL